jgi:Mrr N-terminal domain
MAMNYSDYPRNWEEIRTEVLERAKNTDGISQCECRGECGREHKGNRCLHLQYGCLTTKSKYKVILTTAHLCHDPKCDRRDHLKSMCQPCHQVFDLRERQKREGGKRQAHKRSTAQLGEWAKRGGLPSEKKKQKPKMSTKAMPIPNLQTLLLPVLLVVADGQEHPCKEIRERVGVQFDIGPQELLQKLKNGTPVFHNRVAWALAHLNMRRGPLGHSEAIEKVRKEVYRITEYGKAILKRNPSALTIEDL